MDRGTTGSWKRWIDPSGSARIRRAQQCTRATRQGRFFGTERAIDSGCYRAAEVITLLRGAQVNDIQRMKRDGLPVKQMSEIAGIGRKTVRKRLERTALLEY